MIVILSVYSYLCLVFLLIGVFIGMKGFPPSRIEDYNSPFLLFTLALSSPLVVLVLWLQKVYAFKASETHIGGAALFLICGFLIGSWLESYSSKQHGTYSSIYSRFNRSRMKISTSMIASVWGDIIGNHFHFISITFITKDNYVSTVTVLAVIAGWMISRFLTSVFTKMAQSTNACRSHTLFSWVVNATTIIGLLHFGFLLFQDHSGFLFQKIAIGLLGAPVIVAAILTGIDGSS